MASTKSKGYSAYALRPYSRWMPFEFEALPDFLKSIELQGYLIFQNGYRAFHLHPADQVVIDKTEEQDPDGVLRTRYDFKLPKSVCGNGAPYRFFVEQRYPAPAHARHVPNKEAPFYYNGRRIWQEHPFFVRYYSIHWRFMNHDMPRECICRYCVKKTNLDSPRQLELF